MNKIIIFAASFFCVSEVFSQFPTGDNTSDESFAKFKKMARRSERDTEKLPDSFSLRKYAPPVQSQGELNTCVAWSAGYAARTISYSIKNKLTHTDSIKKYAFSPGYLYYKIKSPADSNCKKGSDALNAMMVMKDTGILLNTEMIQDCTGPVSGMTEKLKPNPYKIKDFYKVNADLNVFTKNEILDIKKSLTENKPVIISMKVDKAFQKVTTSGLWTPAPSPQSGHAMCITGYNDKINGGSFEVMNSWGTRWGNNGFFWLSYEQVKTYGKYAVELMDYEKTRGLGSNNLELSGKINFLKVTGAERAKNILPVTRIKNETAGAGTDNFNLYRITDTLKKGDLFQLTFSAATQSYIYVFAQDGKRTVSPFFPTSVFFPKQQNNSAAINSPNSTYYLPDEKTYGRLGGPDKENFCILYSKSEIDIADLLSYIKTNKTPVAEAVKIKLGPRLIDSKRTEFSDKQIIFHAPADENSVLCFFVEMVHN